MTQSPSDGAVAKAGELVRRIQSVGIGGVGPFKATSRRRSLD